MCSTNSRSDGNRRVPVMPQIDFGKALSNGKETAPRQGEIHVGEAQLESPAHPFRLNAPEWANIIFTAVAVLGGLFSAFYFFNGADAVRSAKNWPKEYLFGRPVF